jgi:peptidoglycan/xylan/chitin deacetylase (PgdA/CDA1 family)
LLFVFSAIFFDDLPKAYAGKDTAGDIRATTECLLQALQAHHAPATGFVNERGLFVPDETDARIEVLRMWLTAGMQLGNHTFSHLDLNKTPLQDYEDDVIHGEVVWRKLVADHDQKAGNTTPTARYFRHPYTHTGETKEKKAAFETFLKSRGYTIAPFTIEAFDWGFNAIYTKAVVAGDKELAQRIRASYLGYVDTMVGYFEQKSRELFGREIPQILLIHANNINADATDEILTHLEKRGYCLVTLGQALSDPAYATKDDYVGPIGPSWLHRWALAFGKPMSFREEPDPPKWILDLYNAK